MLRVFRDRQDAGRQLATLVQARDFERPVVFGIPRGGVIVAAEVASALSAELNVVVARKLGIATQPELAIGATAADGVSYINQALVVAAGIDLQCLTSIHCREAAEARRSEEQFDARNRPDIIGRAVIVIDDGVATGATAIAAVRSLRLAGATQVVFAVPVGPLRTINQLRDEADRVICLHEAPVFSAVGQFYVQFPPVEDADVKAVLDDSTGAPNSAMHPVAEACAKQCDSGGHTPA